MEYTLEIFECLCSIKEASINGIKVDERDFGEHYDHDLENAPEYGCGNRLWETFPHTEEVLKKYSITEEEYYEFAALLDEGLSFGSCGWCV